MARARVLWVLSADFGEYVTASVFCRGQDFDVQWAMPEALARFAPPGQTNVTVYRGLVELQGKLAELRPEVVVLGSGYLFAVNRLAGLEDLSGFMAAARQAGAVLATTDPWLRVWTLRPGTRFAIHSVKQGGIDPQRSASMMALQAALEQLLGGTPHLFAVPLSGSSNWLPFYNPSFAAGVSDVEHPTADEWLFVLAKEDYVFLAGLEQRAFFAALEARIRQLLSRERNRLRFVAPPEVGRFLAERWGSEPRIAFSGYCDFRSFERLLRHARLVVYWNMLSSSLLYCLYYGVPPIFFGAGHLAKVCPGLEEHLGRHVYQGRPPPRLELDAPLIADAPALIRELDLEAWLSGLARDYARAPAPRQVVANLMERA